MLILTVPDLKIVMRTTSYITELTMTRNGVDRTLGRFVFLGHVAQPVTTQTQGEVKVGPWRLSHLVNQCQP